MSAVAPTEGSEDCPSVVSVVICFTSLIGSSNVLARKDQREVCPLSREGMFHPLSIPLQVGFCFFPHPLPTMPWVFLAKGFPGVQGHGRVGSERPSRGHSSPSPRTVRTALTVHGSPFTCTLERCLARECSGVELL